MHGQSRRVALTACVLFGSVFARAVRAQEVRCLSRGQCRQPDSIAVLLQPGGTETILDANFGLVYPSAQGGWEYTCDDIFAGRIPNRTQVASDGRTYVPSMAGLWVGQAGCGWTKATGAFADMGVYDVAFDPTDHQRVWIVGGDPRVVALSTDGGKTFTAKQTFAASLLFIRVVVAPSDPKTIYVSGFNGTKAPLVLAVSTDGGATWSLDENAAMGVANPNQIVDLAGVSPDDPNTIFVVVTNPMGDEVWKSTSKGKNLTKVLTLADAEEWPRSGFTFGADGKTVYVAGFDPLNTGMQPPASLYISRDGGGNWTRHTSPSTGPRYRCIAYRDKLLYACAGEQLSGDQFLLGSSSDEGMTWKSIVKLTDVVGPNACAAAKCSATVDFLRSFSPGVDGGAPPDAAAPVPRDDAGTRPKPVPPKSGCAVAGGSADLAAIVMLMMIAGLARRRRGGG
jgi:photosystem II stability/assembly factor-like uncharacterized protein